MPTGSRSSAVSIEVLLYVQVQGSVALANGRPLYFMFHIICFAFLALLVVMLATAIFNGNFNHFEVMGQ